MSPNPNPFGDKQYRGGAVPGHAPTNTAGVAWSLPTTNNITAHQFGKPGGNDRGNNGSAATARQRKCMEAIESGNSEKVLLKRFPMGMVTRLIALHKAACDMNSPWFLQAQREVYRITIAPLRRKEEEEAAPKEAEVIEVRVGRLEVPMPGAPGDVAPPAASEAG
jgi:hypothetical protein